MFNKFAAVIIAATLFTAPALAQGTGTAAAPAKASAAVAVQAPSAKARTHKVATIKKHRARHHVKHHRMALHVKHIKHVRHARHGKPATIKTVTARSTHGVSKVTAPVRTN